jgi:cysteine-rich repeat protein
MGSRFCGSALVLAGLTLSAAACLDVPGTVCDDGRVCPSGMVCAPTGCALPQQLEACAGKEPGEPCSYAGIQGTCIDGLCISSGCGNGVVDEGEACDDGRRCADGTPCQGACADGSNCQPRGGHGCSRDCLKIEVCGDGFRDEGEACDDGNENPADGCDQCTLIQWMAQAIVGGGTSGTSAELHLPAGVAIDAFGNVFIADTRNHRIRRVDSETGTVTTVAGTGRSAFSGDGGSATSAQLNFPQGVVVDGLGSLFIADSGNYRIRRVDPATGVITTVAGTGESGFSGDGGPATSAQLSSMGSVVVDGLGNLFVSDTANHRVRRVDAATGSITTVAGTGTSGFSGDGGAATSAQLGAPWALAVDGLGNLFISELNNQRVRRVNAADGIITTVVGTGTAGFSGDGGTATSAQLNFPRGLALDSLGNLFIADTVNHRIRRVDTATGIITTVVGVGAAGFSGDGGLATDAEINWPNAVAVDGLGSLFVADTRNDRVRATNGTTGVITTLAGSGVRGVSGDGSSATSARLSFPRGVAVDGLGQVFIADDGNNRIRRVDPATGIIDTVAGSGTIAGFSGDGGPATSAQLNGPYGVTIDDLGTVFLVDGLNHRIRRVDAATGVITTVAGTGTAGFSGDGGAASSAQINSPSGVAVDDGGNVFIADTGNHRIRRVDADSGIITTVAGTGVGGFAGDGSAATSAQLASPRGVAVDGSGNLLIADTDNHRIRRVDRATQVISTVAGTTTQGFSGDGAAATSAQLNTPSGIAVDGLGNLFIADLWNFRVRMVDAVTGVITTVTGSELDGFSGDGGAAVSAQLQGAWDVAVDSLGHVFVADRNNHSIRRVDALAGIITTVAGQVDPEGMGPLGLGRLADPRALVLASPFSLIAGGATGTVQALRHNAGWLEVVAGRYPQPDAIADRARFRSSSFGEARGIAYDASAGLIYLTESTANRIHVVTVVDPDDRHTWTIATLANADGTAGFANGPAATARFRNPTGLFLDEAAQVLYITDTGNHVLRAIDLSNGPAAATVSSVAGTPETLGFFGDYGPATGALLFQPQAVTRCENGDIFLADTGNHRVRRIEPDGTITTVLGDGTAASSGEGSPAITFPVHAPLGLACDPFGNLLVTSTTAVRLVAANDDGIVDGLGPTITIYGAAPRDTFPASVTRCLTGLAIVDATTVQVTDSCTGILLELRRVPAP